MIKTLRFFVAVGLGLSVSVLPLQAAQVLSFTLTEKSMPQDKKSKLIQKIIQKRVVFGDGYFSVREEPLERVYDLNARRIFYINHQAKTVTDVSLYADLAFRIAELQSRIMIIAQVQKNGGPVTDNLYTLESLFGLEGEKTRVELSEEKNSEGLILIKAGSDIVAEIVPSSETPALDKRLLGLFLIYDHSLHPMIRRRILAEPHIPKKFIYRLESLISKDEFSTELNKSTAAAEKTFSIPKNYKHSAKRPGALPEATLVDQLIESVRAGKNKVVKRDQAWFWEKADAALADKDHLNAVIYYLEYGLQAGDQDAVTAAVRQVAEFQKEDENLDRLLRSLGIAGKEQASRAVEELQKLDRSRIQRPHVIDLIIANQRAVLEQGEAAARGIIGALRENPYMTAAYKDLGDLFYGQLDMASAWVCWDFAREISPQHFMVQPISDYEKELVKTYPDFF